jgi:hypothetical protein
LLLRVCVRELFLDPSHWWDHRWSEKVTEHQSCLSSHVNWSHGSCWCQSCCSLLVAILPWCKLGRNSLGLLCTGGIIVVVGWRK